MVLPFLTIYCTNSLGFSIVQAGIVTGCYGAGSLCGALLGGELTDRFGHYRIMVWSLLASAIGLMSLTLVSTFVPLCIAVFLTSTLGDAFRPATMAAVGVYSTPENRTRSISLLRMALNLGISIGPAIGGFCAASIGYTWLFILDGFTCLLATLFLVFLMPSDRNLRETEVIESDTDTPSAYRDLVYVAFLLITAINIVAFMQILSTVPLYLKEVMHLSEGYIGLFFTINGLIVFFLEMPLVAYSEKRFSSFTSMIIGAVLIGLGILTLNIPMHWLALFICYNLLVSLGEIVNFPFGNSLALNRAPEKQRGSYMGMWSMMFSVTFIVAPVLGTFLVEHFGFNVTWWFMAGMSAVSIPGFYFIRRLWQDGNGT